MTNRTLKLATLLMIGAAMAASPVLAQNAAVAGNTGASELPVNRAAPVSLPEITPSPMPTVSGDITSRDIFGTDPEAGLANLGTVSLDRSGDVSETPASEALRAIFEATIQGSTGN
jgi:hypothetical protein